MTKNLIMGLAMLASGACISGAALAEEPSLHQVYQAAEAGRLGEAQTMMQQVLQAHPNSGKAHFVEAELLAKQGKVQQAQAELTNAEKLAPGLPFAKPQAVESLKSVLGTAHELSPASPSPFQPVAAAHESAIPWSMLLTGLGLIAFIVFAVRLMARRQQVPAYAGNAGNASGAYYGARANPPQPANMESYGLGGTGPMGSAQAGPGLGSRIMGGLATGAAVGAGVVAGEALMHHFTDSKDDTSRHSALDLGPDPSIDYSDKLGGSDFGIADSSSWDDAASSDSDWN